MSRITISLNADEKAALARMAMAELRGMREQARWLIRDGLERWGWLPSSGEQSGQPHQETAAPNTHLVPESQEEAAR